MNDLQNALSIELRGKDAKDKLKLEYGKVIENVRENTLASKLKNTDLSGEPTAGTILAKRFVNAKGQAYGTARANGKGNSVKAEDVIIKIDDDTEYMEEVEEKDLTMYGVNGLIERRTANQGGQLEVELDTKFFAEASKGTTFTSTKTKKSEKLEEAILTLASVKNDFVQGVPRNLINVVASPKFYSDLRMEGNIISNAQKLEELTNYEEGRFNNTTIYSSAYLPDDVEFIVMIKGAVAQPVRTSISYPEKVQLSDATAFGLFAYKGTQIVTPDLVFVSKTA